MAKMFLPHLARNIRFRQVTICINVAVFMKAA